MSTGDMQDANLQEALVTYEKLQDIEDEFEEIELEIIRQQEKLSKATYAKRQEVINKIPQFWALVIEQSPPDIDEYIQPSDSALLLSSLVNLTVERFELPDGDPRCFTTKWEFSENEYFENKVLEKKFWYRRANDGWAGLVSEPVDIKWKPGKDLTNGMLDLVKKVWEEEKAGKGKETKAAKQLKKQMEETGLGGVSFFAWFGFRGRVVSDEEHAAATKKEQEHRQARKEGKDTDAAQEDDEDEDEDDEYEMEVFPTGDDLAVCIAEDLWPNAIKYFTNAQDDEELSEVEFLSGDEMDEDDDEDDEDDTPANKKRKA